MEEGGRHLCFERCRLSPFPPPLDSGTRLEFRRLGAVAVAVKLEDRGVMHESVDGGHGRHRILEDLVPLGRASFILSPFVTLNNDCAYDVDMYAISLRICLFFELWSCQLAGQRWVSIAPLGLPQLSETNQFGLVGPIDQLASIAR